MGPKTRSRSLSEREGISNDSSSMLTRKRKASIVSEQNQGTEIKRPSIDYIKQLDGKSFLPESNDQLFQS